MKLEKDGRVSGTLFLLKEAGLLAADTCLNPETGRPAREIRYRLRDNYTRFYLKYIEPLKTVIDEGGSRYAQSATPRGGRPSRGL